MRSIGIDLSARRGLHVAILDEGVSHLPDVATTLAFVARRLPALVAVDAPQAPNPGRMADPAFRAALTPRPPEGKYLEYRACEYLLVRRGLPLYNTPRTSPPGWMQVGFALFEGLFRLGLRLPRDESDREAALFETYPAAIFAGLHGAIPPSKATPEGLAIRSALLAQAGAAPPPGAGHDHLDALACAVAIKRYREGRAALLGEPLDGFLLLPGPPPDRYRRE